jgi:type VI secretion system protein ImpA
MGAALVPGQAPDPAAVLQRGVALLQRTKDVRVFCQVLAASVPVLGVTAFVSGLRTLRELIERFWESLHPELDPEDEARATARANASMACASPELVRALRGAPLLHSRSHGSISLDDALLGLRDSASDGDLAARSAARLLGALREQAPRELTALASSLQLGLAEASAISVSFAERSGAVPDLQLLQAFFRDALAVLRQQRGPESASADAPPGTPPAAAAQATSSEFCSVARNPILSRDDVLQALEQICAYYQAQEPGSPLPLLLRRCQRLVGLDFIATLRELAPEALTKVALISGTSEASRST